MPVTPETTVYQSENLTVVYDPRFSLFVQSWNHNEPLSMEVFQAEMLAFRDQYEFYKPKNTLWLQEGFTTVISPDIHQWVEKEINEPCLAFGNEKVAFVVGKDVMAHLNVFNYFEEEESCVHPKHFACKEEAMDWILGKSQDRSESEKDDEIEITFLGKTKDGKSKYSIVVPTQDTESTLKSFTHILRENAFLKTNGERYFSLTQREKEVFQMYGSGDSFKEIADKLFLSEFTVRTHWRNTKKKLKIKSLSDISDYKNTFL